MKLHTLLFTGTLALSGLVGIGVAQAASSTEASTTQAVPYHYGMKLDIAKVLSITEPTTMECKVITANMKFIDTSGKPAEISYSKLSDACNYQS